MTYYDIYLNDVMILKGVVRKDIESALGCKANNLRYYAEQGHKLAGKYNVVFSDPDDDLKYFPKEWDKVVEPFRGLQWSKTEGRKLVLGGKT